jgi:hypothetical protein
LLVPHTTFKMHGTKIKSLKAKFRVKVTLILTVRQYVCWCQPSAASDYTVFRILYVIVCQSWSTRSDDSAGLSAVVYFCCTYLHIYMFRLSLYMFFSTYNYLEYAVVTWPLSAQAL